MKEYHTVYLRILGRVQGVYYRAWVQENAKARQLSGWVRHRGDGSVEALFHGAAGKVQEMAALCGQGPADARVDALEVIQEGGSSPRGFDVLPTV